MAIVNTVAEFLLILASWIAAYAALLFGLDALLMLRDARRRHRAEVARINEDAAQSVRRISGAFLVAQQLIREEAASGQGVRR
ncbi:Uncharacterised protein [Mycobacteroides abscessus subsp. abscessus]|nr:Uncharacterised protein [Mycobacteroides abscessus subsp. abscessus]